ncbi:MAG: carbohydrate kinase family protein [Candidatus Nanopelagicales bacterium]
MQNICVSASVATDHLMTFSGKFSDSLLPEELANLSVSFLVDNLEIRRGGVGGNIAFALAQFGVRPVLVSAVGQDFADYGSWLERHGVDIESIRISEELHTARFVCTTDQNANQIATFYAGAMSESRLVELQPVADRVGPLDLVLIGATDPVAMERHTQECRERGIAFAADPSQQLSFLDGDSIRRLISDAKYLFSNEYESALILKKTGWTEEELLDQVEIQVTTLGDKGSRIKIKGSQTVEIPACSVSGVVDPTGVGDAFRGGFIAGLAAGCKLEDCARMGSTLAAFVIESVGTQEYTFDRDVYLNRLEANYGAEVRERVVQAWV